MIAPVFSDTPPEIEKLMFEAYGRMSPARKLRKVFELAEMVNQLALADLRRRYPQADERELRIRLAARKYGREIVLEAFSWDPEVHGY